MLDELKEIEEIINRLDSINSEDWNRREDETEEEFEERIQNIEEEIEEELIDVISDSLLNEQELNEEEAVKEAREKIEKEYEIYQDAFERDSNGNLTLKNREELSTLRYESAEEIEKLTTIANNYNDPESYIESIRASIKAQKDIDTEIERKMEVAKVYISAKLRGEEPVIPYNQVKTKKYEDNNEYIRTTKYLNKVPVVQNELINNNRLIAQGYTPYLPSTPRNRTIQPGIRPATARATTSNVVRPRTTVTNPVKVQVLRNVENKMDSKNDLSKQKIKSRTELKRLFKDYENRELNENELNELKAKIQDIEKKYPNTITDKSLNKLYDTFNVKIAIDKSKEIDYIESKKQELEKKASKLQKELNEGIDVNGSVTETNPVVEPVTTENITPSSTPVIKDTARKIALGAIGIGEAIGKFTQKSGEKIESIVKKQKEQARKRRTSRRKDEIPTEVETNIAEVEQELTNAEQTVEAVKEGAEAEENKTPEKEHTPVNQVNYNKVIEEIDKLMGDNFSNLDKNDAYIDINLLGRLCKYLLNGAKNKDGSIALERNPEKAKEYLGKTFAYIRHLKAQAETKYDNPIKNLKNEARFGTMLNSILSGIVNAENVDENGVKLLVQKIDGIELMINAENLKRINNSKNREKLQGQIKKYEEELKSDNNVGKYALEILGDIYYSGITGKNGVQIVKPDIIKARAIYEKMIESYQNVDNSIAYDRLLSLYSDNKLQIYDKKKAEKLETVMKQNGIKRLKHEQNPSRNTTNKGCTYICSDLHGEYEAYKTIIDRIGDKDKLYILGDVIDRGPDGIKILQDIINRQEQVQVEFLIGNHEYMMLRTLLGEEKQEDLWKYNDKETREAYEKLEQDEQEQIKNFLMDSLVYKQITESEQEYYLVHARAIEEADCKSGTYRELSQGEYKSKIHGAVFDSPGFECPKEDIAKKGIFTVIGHNPTFDKIELGKGYVEIDCGISYGDNVSLLNLTTGNVEYFSSEEIRERGKETQKEECREEK